MTSNKVLDFRKPSRRAADGRSDIADLLKRHVEFYDRLSKLPEGSRKIPKAEIQRLLDLLKAVPMPDRSHAVKWFTHPQKNLGESSATASFVSSMGTALDIMPASSTPYYTWRRDRDVLTDDAARIAGDAWVVITRERHGRRRQKDQ